MKYNRPEHKGPRATVDIVKTFVPDEYFVIDGSARPTIDKGLSNSQTYMIRIEVRGKRNVERIRPATRLSNQHDPEIKEPPSTRFAN